MTNSLDLGICLRKSLTRYESLPSSVHRRGIYTHMPFLMFLHACVDAQKSVHGFSVDDDLFCSAGWQRVRPSAGAAARRGSMAEGKDQLSSNPETTREDSTFPDT